MQTKQGFFSTSELVKGNQEQENYEMNVSVVFIDIYVDA